MIMLIFVAYLMAGNCLINGLLHLMMGLLGLKFVKRPKTVNQNQYEKVYAGRLFSSAVFNAVFGLGQIAIVLILLATVGSFKIGLNAETGMLFVGIALSTIFLSWKYEGTISSGRGNV
jgi:hypothetical protein